MKTFRFLALALLASAMGFVSCGDDEVGDEGNKTYVFSPKIDFTLTDDNDAIEAQKSFIKQAFQSVGFAGENMTLELTGKDSAAVSNVLMDKMTLVEKSLQESPVDLLSYVGVRGIEKQYANADNDKAHPRSLWYSKNWAIAENGEDGSCDGLENDEDEYQFVYNIRSNEFGSYWTMGWQIFHNDDNTGMFGTDTNAHNGGDYVYLFLYMTDGKFKWNSSKTYITDVIAVYGGGEPETLDVKRDGVNLTYHKLQGVVDLNRDAGGEYVWLYYTTASYPKYDGYYLNSGAKDGSTGHKKYCCRMHYRDGNFAMSNELQSPTVKDGHRIVERVVQAYDTEGKHIGELDTNNGSGTKHFIRMILTYASKAAIYK